jgi:type II secretory pathway pseudopilin PulG
MVEVLVVLGVIALLVAVLVPAVQSARGAALRMSCGSNLRQIGLAIANYQATYTYYPLGQRYRWLPYLDQQALYDLPWQSGLTPTLGTSDEFWSILDRKCPPIFRCPSDPAPNTLSNRGDEGTDTANYVSSSGVWVPLTGYDGILSLPDQQSNVLPGKWTRTRDVLDGLSNTALCSELLRADGTYERLRTAWRTPSGYGDLDEFAEKSANRSRRFRVITVGGAPPRISANLGTAAGMAMAYITMRLHPIVRHVRMAAVS